ncbi:GNAT family N-acetyltransferase [Pediococcus pentosaceus]|uniref:GNAT family N-acetyltransferase n=1 Tax=Pediococcus pentosaceus TaxID=1255 RepID=UPI003982BFAB
MNQVIIRPARLIDAEKLLALKVALDHESSFMLLSPGEREDDRASIKGELAQAIQYGDCYLVVELGDQLVGYLQAERGRFLKNQHSAYIVVGLLRVVQGLGIGTRLFEQVDRWAECEKISRLELTVMESNQAAQYLYLKMGFEIEGRRRHALKTVVGYEDEFYMAKVK